VILPCLSTRIQAILREGKIKMVKKSRIYTSEFKTEAIKLAIDSNSIGLAAKDLGIPISTLHNWDSKSHISPNELPIRNTPKEPSINIKLLLDKNRELQKRISRLEQEKSILKKAAAYFAREIG
jgi:transposase